MIQRLTIMACLAVFIGSDAEVRAGRVHLVVLSGQSNMARLDPQISFTPALKQALPQDEVIVVKHARSGQPIRRWFKQWKPAQGDEPVADGAIYDKLITKVQQGIGGKTPDTVTFVWMQGERDAREKHGEVYAASLNGLITQLRKDLGREEINVVIGRLSDFHKPQVYPHWDLVRQAQVQVTQNNPRRAWVDTDDLNGPGDDLHYTKKGYAELGRRFAVETVRLLQGKNSANP